MIIIIIVVVIFNAICAKRSLAQLNLDRYLPVVFALHQIVLQAISSINRCTSS